MIKKILVTGGAGYIGSHTVIELYTAGYTPIIVDNLVNSSINNLNGINKILGVKVKWYNADCTDLDVMDAIFKKEKDISGCIHFAAFKSVEESVQNPTKYYNNNIKSLEVLLRCMNLYKIENIIFSSSCTVYGNPDELPVKESAIFKKAASPYAETKQKCEEILSRNPISSVSLRYFNPIGSHASTLIGDCSGDKASNLVPIITEVASGIRKKLIINGSDYNTLDGTCVRDYLHVQDLAQAHVNSFEYVFNKNGKHIFNVGSGKGLSVLEIIKSFERVNNIDLDYTFGQRRNGDVEAIYSNGSLAKSELKWHPKISLDQAMLDAWNWEKQKK